jgi:hypothetical protein
MNEQTTTPETETTFPVKLPEKSSTVKYTARVKRGMVHAARFIREDTDHNLTDLQHPMYRRLKTKAEQHDLLGFIQWMEQEVTGLIGPSEHSQQEPKP